MRNSAILIVKVVGRLLDVEGQEEDETKCYRVIGTSILTYRQFTDGICLKPDPT